MSSDIPLSGLNAAYSQIKVGSNNIANATTTGFKGSVARFFAMQGGASSSGIGMGVGPANVSQQFANGTIEATGHSLDFALDGNGFFVLRDHKGMSYTRNGAFHLNHNNEVVNAAGQHPQIFPPNAAGGFDTGTMIDLNVDMSLEPAKASTKANLKLNLSSKATVPTATTFDPNNSSSYNYATSFTVYDSLGGGHAATTYFVKAAAANTWKTYLYIDGNPTSTTSPPTPKQIVFDTSGALTTPGTGQLSFGSMTVTPGAEPLVLTLDVSHMTQFGGKYLTQEIKQDGYKQGSVAAININEDGVISAIYTNSQSRALGKMALASFTNPQGLSQIKNTNWRATFSSGEPLIGAPGSGRLGSIKWKALESSNTSDVTKDMVNMIRAQRNYQANAKSISIYDNLSQVLMGMVK